MNDATGLVAFKFALAAVALGTFSLKSAVLDFSRVATGGWDGTVRVWEAARGQELLTLKCRTMRVFAVVFSPDGNRLASTTADGAVQIWDATRLESHAP